MSITIVLFACDVKSKPSVPKLPDSLAELPLSSALKGTMADKMKTDAWEINWWQTTPYNAKTTLEALLDHKF